MKPDSILQQYSWRISSILFFFEWSVELRGLGSYFRTGVDSSFSFEDITSSCMKGGCCILQKSRGVLFYMQIFCQLFDRNAWESDFRTWSTSFQGFLRFRWQLSEFSFCIGARASSYWIAAVTSVNTVLKACSQELLQSSWTTIVDCAVILAAHSSIPYGFSSHLQPLAGSSATQDYWRFARCDQ